MASIRLAGQCQIVASILLVLRNEEREEREDAGGRGEGRGGQRQYGLQEETWLLQTYSSAASCELDTLDPSENE